MTTTKNLSCCTLQWFYEIKESSQWLEDCLSTIYVGNVEMHTLLNIIFVTCAKNIFSSVNFKHTPEGRQSKMVCNAPHLHHFIPI